jgi:hypothetical protein
MIIIDHRSMMQEKDIGPFPVAPGGPADAQVVPNEVARDLVKHLFSAPALESMEQATLLS